ncbi:protein kinase [Trypanosoma rangeli SC58]|uniref:mitogen-activated protein kinase kinase n=1 Tax=Trypanosoma rangeli SC58 TaxID=429131 RepID=A0A061IVT5_TRYRA|nr:protein kinase [Trypanosoma rangeli SC58]
MGLTEQRVASGDGGTADARECKETVLEQLLRQLLRQFHARHPRRCLSMYGDSSAVTSGDAVRGRDTSTGYLGAVRMERRNSDAAPSECGSVAQGASSMEGNERDNSALHRFFSDYPTEDEQVFVVANELLQQHIATSQVQTMTTHFSGDAVSEREFSNNNDGMSQLRMSRLNTPDCFSCDNRKEGGEKLPQERLVLMELLRNVCETSMPSRALFAIFEKAPAWSCCNSVRESSPLDTMISTQTSIRSLQTPTEAAFHQGRTNLTTGSEIQNTYEMFGRERRRRIPSLLCLYLQSCLQVRPPSMENVDKCMMRMKWEDPQLANCSVSWRDNSSAGPFSPCMSSEPCSNTQSMAHSKFTSQLKIVSVQGMDSTTRIGRGSSGELFAVRRLDTGELVAVKRIYLTELSRGHVENELSVLRRSIGLSDDGRGNGNSLNMAESSEPSCSQVVSDTHKDDDGNSDVNDYRGVVRFYDAFFDDGYAFIVMELMDSGSLFDALNARRCRPFSEEECRAITFQVLHGLRYLHDTIRQLHRDLKPHNILLNRQTGAVKLTDFGISSDQLQSMGFNQCGTYVGTLAYMSPSRVDADSVYGKESDFWGLGITLIQLALGKLPFSPNVFVIAGFATRPPRLFTEFTRGERETSALDEQETRSTSTLTAFSEAFQDFVATLLPVSRGRGRVTPLAFTEEDDTDSTRSCAYSFGGRGGGDLSCASTGAGCGVEAEAGGEAESDFEACVGHDAVMPLEAWTSVPSPPPESQADVMQELPPPLSLPLPESQGMPQARGNGKDNGSWPVSGDSDNMKDVRRNVAAEEELTVTALLQHPWMRGMTWEKSRTVIAAISLEP